MVSNSSMSKTTEFTENTLSEQEVARAIRALISLASTATEADQVVCEFKPEFTGDETVELLTAKYDYISKIFGVNQMARAAYNPPNPTPLEIAVTNYYSLLSVLILRRWR